MDDILHPEVIVPVARVQAHAWAAVKKFRAQAAHRNPYEAGTDLHRIWQAAADAALAKLTVEGQGA